ncbi:MAG: hypothetical protein QW178_03805 [Candidatus Nitrosocaldus sp.]
MQSKAILTILALGSLLVIGLISGSKSAHATASITAVGSPYPLNATGQFDICVDVNTTIDKMMLFRPDNSMAWQTTTGWSVSIPAGTCSTVLPGTLGFSGFDMVGKWIVVANDTDGNPFIFEFAVTFLVVPESIIGAVAAVATPLAAFAGFKVLRSRNK